MVTSLIKAQHGLAEAARNAEVEALAMLGVSHTPVDALTTLAICTARYVRAREPRKPLESGKALSLPVSAWMQLLEFLALDPTYRPSETFPYTKWDLATALLLAPEETDNQEVGKTA